VSESLLNGHDIKTCTCSSPSPQPSPSGRGSNASGVLANRSAAVTRETESRCSLSLGERAGVRGNAPLANQTPAESPDSPSVRGEGFFRVIENVFIRLDQAIQKFLPTSLNPLGQLGAVANTCLIIAVISGVALLLWYTPSVHQAYDSLEKVRASSWLGQLTRSLHRYSSDGCVFFVLLHALRIAAQRRFTGARWLAWTTGLLMLALLWSVGWTGYWLVWDVRGQHAALGTARFLDCLPIFTEPLSRSFLTDQSVHSLLFFIVFFAHMLMPLALAVGLWMHLMRVNRSHLFTGRTMTLWVLGSLLVTSALLPATSADAAHMTVKAQKFTLDWWYLWPLAITDRLGGGVLWSIFLGGGLAFLTVPWWMAKRRRTPEWTAQVEVSRCMGCTLCAKDCPFDAITMIPREDGKKFAVQALVNPALCVGCGVCTGACDSEAINMPAFNSRDAGQRVNAWIDAQVSAGVRPFVAFVCGNSALASLRANAQGNWAELPGWRIERVPCTGWVSAVLLERTLQRGAAGVLVVGCGESDPVAREGMKWFEQRLAGTREPKFDERKADPSKVKFIRVARTNPGAVLEAARLLQAQLGVRRHDSALATPPEMATPSTSSQRSQSGGLPPHSKRRARPIAAAVTVSLALCGITFAFSNLPYRTPHSLQPELVVSFIHNGAIVEPRKLTKEELAQRLPHMRAQVNVTRQRSPVRLRVHVDGRQVFENAYTPKGVSKDGPSVAVARLPVSAGVHEVRVEISDNAQTDTWTRWTNSIAFDEKRTRVVLFDTKAGFSVH